MPYQQQKRIMSKFFMLLIGLFLHSFVWANYAEVTADKKGAVASVHPIATQAGLDAFAKGGNAIDAALAVAFTLGVVDSPNSGIGGGCFIVVRLADGTTKIIDGREIAPALAYRDMFLVDGKAEPKLSKTGALAIGVPGSVAALNSLQKQAGKLKWSDVLLPAADIAEKGFEIDNIYAKRLGWVSSAMAQFPESKSIFLDKEGKAIAAGTLLKQKDLAKTYRALAKKGPDYFYKGEFARKIDDWMQKNGGFVRYADFAKYQLLERKPLISEYRGYSIVGFPPPSSGGVHVAQILNILENFDFESLPEADRYHLIIEAMKLAFADRAYWLGDPAFTKVPRGLMAMSYAKELAKKIDLKKSSAVTKFGTPPNADKDIFDKHTTHIATADKDGNWVAITTTLNTSFGSKVTVPGTGVLMNNQMDDFSAEPGAPNAFGLVGIEANSVQGGKRPLSSMSPTIVLKDDKPVLTVGAAGGPTIISQVMQSILNYVALEMPIDKAIETVRVHHQWQPDRVYIDGYSSEDLRKTLTEKGHEVKIWPPFGATQAIALDDKGEFIAVSEPRLIARSKSK